MKNNTLKNIFDKDIEFKFKLADLFAIQFDSYGDGVNCETFAYVEEIQNKIKEETTATITNHIFNQLKEDVEDIKRIIHSEVERYRKNSELIIKNEANEILVIKMSELKNDILKQIKDELTKEISREWDIKLEREKIKNEILKKLNVKEEE